MQTSCHQRPPVRLHAPACSISAWRAARRRHGCAYSVEQNTAAIAGVSMAQQEPSQHEASVQRPALQDPQAPVQAAVPAALAGAADDERSKRLWKMAIKLPMYSVGYIPVLVGGAGVYLFTGSPPWLGLLGFATAAVLVIAWLNLSNDYFDSDTGVDVNKAESVVNLTGNRQAVGLAAAACLAVGVGLLWTLISRTGDSRPAALLAFSIACGYVYQGPPFRLSYKGLGEPLCFMAFGPSATTAFFLAMLPPAASAASQAAAAAAASWLSWVPAWLWACSVAVGLSTTTILLTSHFHQIEGDIAAGKQSPLVRMGLDNGLRVVHLLTVATYGALVAAACAGSLPWAVVGATLVSLPAAHTMLSYAREHYKVPQKIMILKRFACMWHIALGFSLAGGMAAARLVMA